MAFDFACPEFSFRSRVESLKSFSHEEFDILVIGGGITGVATARDAASRGLKVALVDRRDFASGTSSRSSKLIHGGLRYLENFELGLVFEALSERTLLLKTVPHLVRPLPFYLPVYESDAHGMGTLAMGLWLYDLLALFRSPGFHRRLSQEGMIREIPVLDPQGLKGGFAYFDASMWDDGLVIETARSASRLGAQLVNYVSADKPIWSGKRVVGYELFDEGEGKSLGSIKAKRVIVCAGPWTDLVGSKLGSNWKPWLQPSKGVHLIFDGGRIPIPGAIIMSHPEDGRVSFVIPRKDLGPGVVIVGTTDGPTDSDPERAVITKEDVSYLMNLLDRYFPKLKLQTSDILSAYVGVRPLMGVKEASELQKISREHYIGRGPGGAVLVAGGKYTTHRKMAEEIIDFTLETWLEDSRCDETLGPPPPCGRSKTNEPVNPMALSMSELGGVVPPEILSRYGGESSMLTRLGPSRGLVDPTGFPMLEAQLRFSIQHQMVLKLSDFVLRRTPLFACLADHGFSLLRRLAEVWAEERALQGTELSEAIQCREELEKLDEWRDRLK